MYGYKNFMFGSILLASLALAPFVPAQAEAAAYKPSGDEIAGVRVRVGGGYYPYYRGGRYYRYNRPYPYYRYNYPRYYPRYYYNDPYNYYYNYPRRGIYFNW